MPVLTTLDELPGDVEAVASLALRCRRLATALAEDADRLGGAVREPSWAGPAARAFEASVHGLPRELRAAAESYATVARALTAYAAELTEGQRRARAAVVDHRAAAVSPYVPAAPGGGGQPELDAWVAERGRMRALAERRHAAAAADVAAAAVRAARTVTGAADPLHERPDRLSRALDGVGDWVVEHAEVLAAVAEVLAVVASAATMACAVPALVPVCAPLAVTAAVVSLAVEAALASRGRGSWQGVAVGVVSAAVPPARVARQVTPAPLRVGPGGALDRVVEAETHPARARRRSAEETAGACH